MISLKKVQKEISKIIKNKIKLIKFIDWLIIVFLFSFIGIISFLLFRKSSVVTATIKVGEETTFYSSWISSWGGWSDLSASKKWYGNLFQVGQIEKDGLGKIRAEVIDIFSYPITPVKTATYLKVKLKVVYNRSSNTYTYKGVPILIGSQIKLNLDKIYVEGMITELDEFPQNQERKKIIVDAQIIEEKNVFPETTGTYPFIAESINEGDEINDNNGRLLIKVIKKIVEPAKKVVVTSNGEVLLRNDPLKKDVLLTLEINVIKKGDQYFLLDDIPIIIGQIIPINSNTLSIFPVITRIHSK